MLEITNKVQNDQSIIYVNGRVDSTNSPEFEKECEVFDTKSKLVFDVEKLEYISSAGLRVILKFRKKHEDLEIINASTDVYDIFDMTGFTDMMTIKRAYRVVNVDGCEVIGQGANGEVYRIDPDTVVKVYLNPDSLSDIEHERDVARKALVLGIPTAISYDVVKVGDHYASMFEMLNAKSFSKLLKDTPEKVDEYAKRYVDLLKLIHQTEVPKGQLPDQKEVFMTWIGDVKPCFDDETFNKISKLAQTVPHDDHMIHGDYHTKNLMLQNDEVILIDMDTLAIGHPVLEFASIYNAYIGFYLTNHTDDMETFIGFKYKTGVALWKKTLEFYYNTTDKDFLAYKENQAKFVGLIRILRRTLRRKGDENLIETCKKEICELANTLETLI